MTGQVAADLMNTAFPSDCPVCGGPRVELNFAPVCEACVTRLDAHRVNEETGPLCGRCGEALSLESARFAAGMQRSGSEAECTMCRLAPPEFAKAVAFANYDNEVREMLHLLKFNGMRAVAERVLGEGMAAAVLKLEGLAASELVVVPVPLFGARQRSRGFNQAQVLAEVGVAKLRVLRPAWKLAVHGGALARVRDTRAQFALPPHLRRKNLRGAFRVADADAIRGREVLLVDDIMTTGATARECARVLLRAGATKVWVVTMARAQTDTGSHARPEVAMWDAAKQPSPPSTFT
jgi:ComF family protein